MSIKYAVLLGLVFIALARCEKPPEMIDFPEENWGNRKAAVSLVDSLTYGKSYLSVYSQIYSFTQHKKYNLTGMISLRNVSERDTLFLLRADYYNTKGDKIRTYFDYPVYLLPMETLEIVIAQEDVAGGTGGNFLFEWAIPAGCPEPLFEGLMNSVQGTQGLSFITTARRIE